MSRFPARCCVMEYEIILFHQKETPASAGGNHPDRPGNIHNGLRKPLPPLTRRVRARGLFQGTYATNIDPSGTIIGFSRDANDVRHGFIRSQDGSFTIFDAPGAGTGSRPGDAGLLHQPEWNHYGILH